MSVDSLLAGSWAAFERAGMTKAAVWTNPVGSSVTTSVMFDAPGSVVLNDVLSTDYVATFRADAWPSVRPGDAVSVAGAAYRVREVLAVGDALLSRATLVRLD